MTIEFLSVGLAAFAAVVHFSIAAASLIIFPLLALWVLSARSTFRFSRPTCGPVEMAFAGFLVVSLISALTGVNPTHSLYIIYKKDLYFIILVFAAALLRQRDDRERVVRFFVTAGFFSAAMGLAQFAVGINRTDVHGPLTILGLVAGRAAGTQPHPLFYAELLQFVLALCASSMIYSPSEGWRRWLLSCWLVLGGLIVSLSRGPWLAAGVMLFVAWIRAPYRRSGLRMAMTFLPFLAILIVPALRGRAETLKDASFRSNAERLDMWRVGTVLWRSHPLLGIGPGNVKTAAAPFENEWERADGGWGHLHNLYVNFAVERGTAGLLAYLGMLAALVVELLKGLRLSRDPADRLLIWAALLGLLGFAQSGLTETDYNTAIVLMTFYLITGSALAAARADAVEYQDEMS